MKIKLTFIVTLVAIIYIVHEIADRKVLANGDSLNKYEFLVPKLCQKSVMSELLKFQTEEQLNYKFTKLYEQGDIFENVVGIVTLYTTDKHDYLRLLNIKSEVVNRCYPNTVLSFKKDSSGWSHLAETVEKLERDNIVILSVQIDSSHVKILYHTTE